jgi:hypothetical protein
MISIENTKVEGWEAAIRGMRNPMNSWEQSDTRWLLNGCEDVCPIDDVPFLLGDKDEELMRKLVLAGSDHRKFLRFINVTMDITAPLYWWKEFKTYKVGRKFADDEPDVIAPLLLETDVDTNSCSTMHKIHSKPFEMADFSHDKLNLLGVNMLKVIVDQLEANRLAYLENKDKRSWWQLIQLLPSSYNQRRTYMFSYAALRSIYHARKNHKLTEWHSFCRWVESLPYAAEFITDKI